ncbi:hypothetical protein B0H11DRAFT_2199513 [Mycena galericulata]|nr:hypothetical protein B0H11DRAFT_2199513 [Mycena galericulata]
MAKSRAPCTIVWLVTAQTLMTGFPNWDVMRGCVRDYPNATEDIGKLQGWLESNNLQTYVKERPGKDQILRVRDLMVSGAAYANTPGAFKNFRRETRKVSYKKTTPATVESESDEEEDVQLETEMQLDDVEQDDLMHDDEDFTDMADELVGMAKEVVGI